MDNQNISDVFRLGLKKLGFEEDDCLFLVDNAKKIIDSQIEFHIETTKEFKASAVYLRRQLNGTYKPQVFLFDFTNKIFNDENELTEIQKKIWTSGEAPLACIFYKTEIKILDCTKHIKDNYTPEYLINNLKIVGKAHDLYNEQFAIKIRNGTFWELKELKNKFKFQNSAYDKLINNIRIVITTLIEQLPNIPEELVNKIIIQSILIKYLEERIDNDGNKLLSEKYFQKYDNASTFNDVLKKGKFIELLSDLNHPEKGFNGNIFRWDEEEIKEIKEINLSIVAELLDTSKTNIIPNNQLELKFPNWRYFEFKYVPVELISRLYEEFLGKDKKQKGLYYTPAHLARLLVDECLPLSSYESIDAKNYTILDPACGSGIFLVIAFKRLVQIWRLNHDMASPELDDLKNILKNIYGVDKEEQAINLASFSLCLALCNELNPVKIINELKFDDLRETNLIHSDFFFCEKIKNKKFDLIIGNPPFVTGALSNYSDKWPINDKKVKIPKGQIALKFLTESLPDKCNNGYLKSKGLLCLIVKSSVLLYNDTSSEYKKALFSNFNVIQLLDFTALARNKSLWDNGADVASVAIFLRNEKPDFSKNILHLTFRRTKATKERIIFEIDDYDLHFVNRNTAIENSFIWKNNLLGGGRIKSIVEKYSEISFKNFLKENDCIVGEGFKIGSKGHLNPNFIYEIKTMPTEAIDENKINLDKLKAIDPKIKFEKIPNEKIFTSTNILIKENIGQERIPIHLNKTKFSYQHKIIGIACPSDSKILDIIIDSFKRHNDLYRFYIYVTSGQLLINLNTAILKADIMRIPFMRADDTSFEDETEIKIINDVNTYMQDFLRHGEGSLAIKPIENKNYKAILSNYGLEFCKSLNTIYGNQENKFRMSEVVNLENSFFATIFTYDDSKEKTQFHDSSLNTYAEALSKYQISPQLTANRIIKLYPYNDTIIFIKPNQNRYWLSLMAYRDADKCFSDFSNSGF